MSADLVEKVRYEADISDIQAKLRTLGDRQDAVAAGTEKSASRMTASWGKVRGLVSTGAKWFAGISAASALIIPGLLESGVALASMDAKAKVVFSDQSLAQVQSWAEGVAGSFGLTQREAVAMATSMGDLFKPMGFTADEAARLSTELGDMSGALGAWSGGKRSAVEVSQILTKAILGERDGLVELGIKISEADVQARLAANGTAHLTGKQLEQAKAAATLALIQDKSTDALKAWTDGTMDSAKEANKSKASFSELVEMFVEALGPAIKELIPAFRDLIEIAKDLTPVLGWIADGVGAVAGAVEWLRGDVEALGEKISDPFKPEITGSISDTAFTIGEVGAALVESGDASKQAAQDAWEFSTAEHAVADEAAAVARGLEYVKQAHQALQEELAGTAGWTDVQLNLLGIDEKLAAANAAFKRGELDAQEYALTIQDITNDAKTDIADYLIGLDTIPAHVITQILNEFDPNDVGASIARMQELVDEHNLRIIMRPVADFSTGGAFGTGGARHNGGIVDGMPGTEVLVRLLPGERVLTESQQRNAGKGGVTINGGLHVHTDDDPRRFYDEGMWRVAS